MHSTITVLDVPLEIAWFWRSFAREGPGDKVVVIQDCTCNISVNIQHTILIIQSVKPTERVKLRIKNGYLFNINHQICSNTSAWGPVAQWYYRLYSSSNPRLNLSFLINKLHSSAVYLAPFLWQWMLIIIQLCGWGCMHSNHFRTQYGAKGRGRRQWQTWSRWSLVRAYCAWSKRWPKGEWYCKDGREALWL